MSLELVMNANGTVVHGSGSTITGGTFTIISTPNTKAKIDNYGIYTSPLQFTFAGGSAPGFVGGTVTGSGSISSTATKVKSGTAVMRDGDSGTLNASGTLSVGGTGTVSGNVEIVDAGQQHVKAE